VASAVVLVAGSWTATGQGTASCEAWLEERTASATATGRGVAVCRLTAVVFEPLARNSGTRSVCPANADVRSVRRVHNRLVLCGPDDLRLRGPRRRT